MSLIPRGRRLIGSLVLATAMTIVPAVAVSAATWTTSAASGTTGCAVTWGSLPKSGSGPTTEPITNLRAGRHLCFDRLVVDLGPVGDGRPDFWVGYVDTWSPHDGTYPQPRGGARISIIVTAPVFANGTPLSARSSGHQASMHPPTSASGFARGCRCAHSCSTVQERDIDW
jgi:hypothetical protein